MKRELSGQYVTVTEGIRAFVPAPLPPAPPLSLDPDLSHLLDRAHVALGRLDGVSGILPDAHLFLYTYVRKEAVLSSQIEGTQSSLSDLLLFELDEAPGVPFDDVVEVSNYVAALEHGLRPCTRGIPDLQSTHSRGPRILLSRGRGRANRRGNFDARRIGSGEQRLPLRTSFHHRRTGWRTQWRNSRGSCTTEPSRTPTLLKAALSHVQFETIHPFLDGNGRVGRLLIPMLLCVEGVLRQPLLYLSLYFKQHRSRYYELLDRVRAEGDWEEWVEFFAAGVEETANGAVATAHRLLEISKADRERVKGAGRVTGSAIQVHQALLSRPIHTIARLAVETRLSVPAVTNSIAALTELGMVREITGRKRGRVFVYGPYLDVLQQGMEPP